MLGPLKKRAFPAKNITQPKFSCITGWQYWLGTSYPNTSKDFLLTNKLIPSAKHNSAMDKATGLIFLQCKP